MNELFDSAQAIPGFTGVSFSCPSPDGERDDIVTMHFHVTLTCRRDEACDLMDTLVERHYSQLAEDYFDPKIDYFADLRDPPE